MSKIVIVKTGIANIGSVLAGLHRAGYSARYDARRGRGRWLRKPNNMQIHPFHDGFAPVFGNSTKQARSETVGTFHVPFVFSVLLHFNVYNINLFVTL